jgi:hypothetical protein
MNVNNAFPSDFKNNKEDSLNLYIEGNSKLLQLAVFNCSQQIFCGVKQYYFENSEDITESIPLIFDDEILASLNFERSTFSYCSSKSMLVPETLFDAKNLNDFLKFHQNIDENDELRYFQIPRGEAFIIYSCPASIESALKLKFPAIQILHHSIPFINTAIQNDTNENIPCVHIFLGHDFFDLLVIKQNKIQLFNSFFYSKHADVLYFLINISNLFSIPPYHSKIFLSGNIEDIAFKEISEELKMVFPNINQETLPNQFKFADEINTLSAYQLNTLIGLRLCE